MYLILNNQKILLTTIRELPQYFDKVRQRRFSELWITTGDNGPSLTMLINGESAWLMYLQNSNDSGFHTVNPSYNGSAEACLEFMLSNGQIDEYPLAWTLTLKDAFDACEYFVATQGGRPPTLVWEAS